MTSTLSASTALYSSNPATQALLEASYIRYQAQYKQAEANLIALISSPVGIGEHTDYHLEIDKFIDQMAAAQDRMDTLMKFRAPVSSIPRVKPYNDPNQPMLFGSNS
jgi:hypothetical protein